jgi:hypothetical protein
LDLLLTKHVSQPKLTKNQMKRAKRFTSGKKAVLPGFKFPPAISAQSSTE